MHSVTCMRHEESEVSCSHVDRLFELNSHRRYHICSISINIILFQIVVLFHYCREDGMGCCFHLFPFLFLFPLIEFVFGSPYMVMVVPFAVDLSKSNENVS